MILDKQTYVKKAENVILTLKKEIVENSKTNSRGKRQSKMISTSQIRNILAMSADIYNEVVVSGERLPDELNARIDYLKVRCVYESGRNDDVKMFILRAEILQALGEINGSKERFILFNHYMEALVAYHRFYGGSDI